MVNVRIPFAVGVLSQQTVPVRPLNVTAAPARRRKAPGGVTGAIRCMSARFSGGER